VRRYVLTERGKILVASLIAFFLILPSLILVIWVLPRVSSSKDLPPASNGEQQNGSESIVIDPPPVSTPDPIDEPSDNYPEDQEPLDPNLTGVKTFDFDAGILTFLFTPELQTALDDNITSMIGELLTSPKNIDNAKISVEIPNLPDEETEVLTTAIINAFTKHDVSLSDIVFFVYQPKQDEQTFAIKMYFQ